MRNEVVIGRNKRSEVPAKPQGDEKLPELRERVPAYVFFRQIRRLT